MTEITYLLGAGASYNALPIVSQMSKRIKETAQWLNNTYIEHRILNRFNTSDSNKFKDVILDLDWLGEMCDTKRNFSIDTYARKLKISGKEDE